MYPIYYSHLSVDFFSFLICQYDVSCYRGRWGVFRRVFPCLQSHIWSIILLCDGQYINLRWSTRVDFHLFFSCCSLAKLSKQRVEDILFLKNSRTFRFVTLPWKIKWHFTQGNSTKIVLHPLKIPKPKTNTHGNVTWFFLHHHWKFHCFISWPLEFPHSIFSILLEIPCPQPCLFLNIPLISINQSINQCISMKDSQCTTYKYIYTHILFFTCCTYVKCDSEDYWIFWIS